MPVRSRMEMRACFKQRPKCFVSRSVHWDLTGVDGQLSKWSESKGIYEVKQQRFSVSGFVLNLKRISTPFLTNTYFPTGLLTIISFIGFVIPVDIVPGRMALLVTIFLMLVNTSSTERSRGPKVNRNDKRIDRIL